MRRRTHDLHARNFHLKLGADTKIMGIINLTPDSFSRDGQLARRKSLPAQLQYALDFIAQGADILDVGGESTRPGAKPVSAKEESRRIIPLIKALAVQSRVPISVDTYKMDVAQAALDAGASIINNIMAIKATKPFLKMVRDYDAALVLMHMRGTPQTMQRKTKYKDVVVDVIAELNIVLEKCLEIGIKRDKIIIDPGIGFAKTPEQNLLLLNRLHEFQALRCPVLLGTSRKSFIGHVLNKDVRNRLMGSAATVSVGICNGAHMVRVHDVNAMKEVARVTDAIVNAYA